MGNCQSVDTATLVIQHPSGKAERMYWPVSAGEVMKTNPGHYVALLISSSTTSHAPNPTTTPHEANATTKCSESGGGSVRVTRIKLLRPTDTLMLGQVYRLITTQEVMKGLWAKKCAKMRKIHGDFEVKVEKNGFRLEAVTRSNDLDKNNQVSKEEKERSRRMTGSTNHVGGKSRTWQPSLQSISEATT